MIKLRKNLPINKYKPDNISYNKPSISDYQLEYSLSSSVSINHNEKFLYSPIKNEIEIISNVFRLELTYISNENIYDLLDKSKNSNKNLRRLRILSEDNLNPSFQVVKFDNFIMKDDYVNSHYIKKNMTFHKLNKENEYISQDGININYTNHFNVNTRRREKAKTNDCSSKNSTDMISFFKSIDEISNDSSLKLMFEENNDIFVNKNDETNINEDNKFNLEEIIKQAEDLKILLK